MGEAQRQERRRMGELTDVEVAGARHLEGVAVPKVEEQPDR